MDSNGQTQEDISPEEFISDEALANNMPKCSDSMPSANGLDQMLDILDNNQLELPENESVDDNQLQQSGGIKGNDGQTDDDKLTQSMVLMDKKKAYNLLTEGKRNFMVKDFNSAATMLSKASAYFAKIFGDFGLECADVYFSYGKALLELSRQENDVMAVPEDGEEDDADDGDGVEGDHQNGDAETQDKEGLDGDSADDKKLPEDTGSDEEKKSPQDIGSGEEEKPEIKPGEGKKLSQESAGSDETKCSQETESTPDTESSDKTEPSSSNELAGSDDDPDEVNNLQLAWEMIEMAKIVYERNSANEKILPHLADVYLKLGEISMEQENYETAVSDIIHAVDLRKRSNPTPDRVEAELYYKLGLAYQLNYCYEEAAQALETSKNILESLKMNVAEKSAHEIEEFNTLVASINEKLGEVVQSKIETKKAIYSLLMGEPVEDKNPEKTDKKTDKATENKVATDISHLVKKKRKQEGEPAVENASKMARLEDEK